MGLQSVVFTSLPHGVDRAGQAILSVHVAPRLRPPGRVPLSTFGDWFDWPATLRGAGEGVTPFTVEVDGSPVAARHDPSPLDSKLWRALFAKAEVGIYQFRDLSARELRSFSTTRILDFITGLYRAVVETSPTTFPRIDRGPVAALREVVGPHHRVALRMEDEQREARDHRARQTNLRKDIDLDAWKSIAAAVVAKTWDMVDPFAPREHYWEDWRAKVLDGKVSRDTALDLYEATRFYSRLEGREPYRNPKETGPLPPPRPVPPDPDFHEELGFLADHPALLRRLGLVIDLIVDVPATKAGRIRVVPTFPLADGNNIVHQPITRFERDGDRFEPQVQDSSRQRGGYLCLDVRNHYEVVGLDVDGSALKLADFALNLERRLWRNEPPEGEGNRVFLPERDRPETTSLPALRTAGFAVVERERADRVAKRLQRSKTVNALLGDSALELWAEDLTRGYRIEVDDSSGVWRSLCRRDVTYAVTGVQPFTLSGLDSATGAGEQGYVKGASTSEVPGVAGPLYLHESLFGWDGWSLVVSRPGRAIPIQGRKLEDAAPVAPTSFPLVVGQAAPLGTLPRLRYGRPYRFRARTVDLAGNSTALDEPGRASPVQRHLRYEPVVSPALVPRRRYTEGESLRCLVIRSDIHLTAEAYATSPSVVAALAGWDHTYRPTSERHVAPPKVAQAVAELHGRFDPFIGPGRDHGRGLAIAKREKGTFLDTAIVDIHKPGAVLAVAGIVLVDQSRQRTPAEKAARAGALALRLADIQTSRGKELDPGNYVIHDTNALVLPYLPDPLAVSAALYGLPGTEDAAGHATTTVVPFEGTWPELAPFRILLAAGPPAIEGPTAGVLTVRLPPSHAATVTLSCGLHTNGLATLGIWDLLSSTLQTKFEPEAVQGRVWLLTPGEQVHLVHAVQHPLEPPKIDPVRCQPGRHVGTTWAWFARQLWCHSRSTGRIDVEAAWTEWLDDLAAPEGTTEARTGHAFDFTVDSDEAHGEGWLAIGEHARPRFGSRAPDGSIQHVEDPTHRAVHELGDTKYRRITYTPVGTTRFREHFPPAITADPANITSRGVAVAFDVPNAARPATPLVRYIVPTFRWDEDHPPLEDPAFRRRRTGGLRVFVERPWWSSGEGELLGVVLRQPPGAARVGVDRLEPYVTAWGADPVWASGALPADLPAPHHFHRHGIVVGEHLTLRELHDDSRPGSTVSIVGHPVQYDKARRVWFCDIELDAGRSYFPFVRLAVARYQPHSLTNCHLSVVVRADFAQLAAGRSLTVTLPSLGVVRVAVTGVGGVNDLGHSLLLWAGAPGRFPLTSRVVTAALERRDPAITGDLAWEPVGEPVVLDAPNDSSNEVTWSGSLVLPEALRGFEKGEQGAFRSFSSEGRLRLVVRECDQLAADPPPFRFGTVLIRPTNSRLVYADAIEL